MYADYYLFLIGLIPLSAMNFQTSMFLVSLYLSCFIGHAKEQIPTKTFTVLINRAKLSQIKMSKCPLLNSMIVH